MNTKLRNVTITLEEEPARWARVEAARNDTSVSQYLAALVKKQIQEKDEYELARGALSRQPFLKANGRYLSRQESHDGALLR